MATLHNYIFDNMTRIGEDSCGMSQRNIQNAQSGNYMLSNYFSQDCGMKKPIDFATSQPNVFYKGGHQVGAGGCNVDDNSQILIGSQLTHPKCRISLYERPFKTVPYLGRGMGNTPLESQLQHGDFNINRKSVNQTSEQSHMNHRHYPLIPSIQATVTNPSNLVEGVAAEGWIRGGLPSRSLTKDKDYMENKNPYQY